MSLGDDWKMPSELGAVFWRRRFEDADRARLSAERWIRLMGVMGCTATLGAAVRQDVVGLEARVAEMRDGWIEWNSWQGLALYSGLALASALFARSWWRVK